MRPWPVADAQRRVIIAHIQEVLMRLAGLFHNPVPMLAWLVALSLLGTVHAQSARPDAAGAASAIVAAEILARADQDQRFVDRVLRQLARPAPAEQLSQALKSIEHSVDEKLRTFAIDNLKGLPVNRLESLERHWKFDARRFRLWQIEAKQVLKPLDDASAEIGRRRTAWELTRTSALTKPLPPMLRDRIDTALTALTAAEQALEAPLASQIDIGRRANLLDAQIETGQAEVEDTIAAIDWRLLQVDSPPLWAALAAGQAPSNSDKAIEEGLDIEARFAHDYATAATGHQRALLIVQPLLLLVLLLLRFKGDPAGLQGPDDAASGRVMRRTISCWVLLAMMAVLVLEPDAPLLAHQIAMLLALIPLLRLLPVHRLPVLGGWQYVVIGLYMLDTLGVVLMASGSIYRLFYFGLTLLAWLATLGLLWRARRQDVTGTRGAMAALAAAWAIAALLFMSLVSNLLGNVSLADTLTSGVIDCGYFGLLLHATVEIARAMLRTLLATKQMRSMPLVRNYDQALLASMSRVLVLAAVLGWLAYALNAFRVMRPVQGWLTGVLSYDIEVGEISVSLGDLLVFAVSVLIASWVARLVRNLLGEQLSARQSLPRGVASSVASLTYYALLLLGFLLALSAAGFKVSQLALVFGALGVGIGFGLQNIVNNFVSGLVLMFERPLRPGDIVEVGGASGRVRQIGLRATIIRTFDGADMVVPNGSLLAGNLTNWTLLDHSRRIEVELGVAYGSDPTQVLALLEATARATPGVAVDPAPSALFRNYGNSSLDFVLRVWTTDGDRWPQVRSAVMTRVLEALADAGIQIPFNQMDVHLVRAASDTDSAS